MWSLRLFSTSFLHEGRFVAIKLGEPSPDIGNSRLKQDTLFHLSNSDLVSFETEFTWKTHGLTPAIAKQFGGLRFRHPHPQTDIYHGPILHLNSGHAPPSGGRLVAVSTLDN
jgi:hypothetical protein